ncbi:hypothetical protein [Rhodoflexus sp.]
MKFMLLGILLGGCSWLSVSNDLDTPVTIPEGQIRLQTDNIVYIFSSAGDIPAADANGYLPMPIGFLSLYRQLSSADRRSAQLRFTGFDARNIRPPFRVERNVSLTLFLGNTRSFAATAPDDLQLIITEIAGNTIKGRFTANAINIANQNERLRVTGGQFHINFTEQ